MNMLFRYREENRKSSFNIQKKMCDIKHTGSTPPQNCIMLSCSIFKLKNMYKSIEKYANGLEDLINFITNEKKPFFIRVYFDKSIKHDPIFINLYKKYVITKNVQFSEYTCPNYIMDGFHRGIFGMFVRFFPLFELDLDVDMIYITDIDYEEIERVFYLRHVVDTFLSSDKNVLSIEKIGYEWKYADKFRNDKIDGTCLANLYVKKSKVTLDFIMITDVLERLRNNDKELVILVEEMYKGRLELGSEENQIQPDTFTYGIDEWFINKFVIEEYININAQVGTIYINDFIQIYPNNIIKEKSTNTNKLLDYYKEFNIHTSNIDKAKKTLSQKIRSKLVNIHTIKNADILDSYIEKYVLTTERYVNNNKISVDNEWYKNLLKHKYASGPILHIFRRINNKETAKKILNYYGEKLKIFAQPYSNILEK